MGHSRLCLQDVKEVLRRSERIPRTEKSGNFPLQGPV